MLKIKYKDPYSKARTGTLQTDHGVIETPIFMPVGTHATVKAVKQNELKQKVRAQIILGNTYHLYLRPGTRIISEAKGLHAFMGWDLPILTDSGGYQVFSLSDNRTISEEGVSFKSHLDGSKQFFTPENIVDIQRQLGSDILMMLDECPPYPATEQYVRESMELTHRWAKRGKEAFDQSEPKYGHRQFQFAITQGGTFKEYRRQSTRYMVDLDPDGLAIGGLSVGEPAEYMYEMTDLPTDYMPQDKPRYLMGVGRPENILESVARGIDMFDCVMPTRNARNGMLFTRNGTVNVLNAKWKHHHKPLEEQFPSELCSQYNFSYIHHLFKCNEILGLELASLHNLTFYLWLMHEIRERIKEGSFNEWYPGMAKQLMTRL